jgi:serine/threonine protein kinase
VGTPKSSQKSKDPSKKNNSVMNEIMITEKFKGSEYIVQFHTSFIYNNSIKPVFEYCNGGDLVTFLNKQAKDLFPIQKLQLAYDILRGLCEIHEKNIIHRDLKVDNILVEKRKTSGDAWRARICDFGLALDVTAKPNNVSFCGTHRYQPPEVFMLASSISYKKEEFEFYKTFGFQMDVWNIGTVLYILLNKMDIPWQKMDFLEKVYFAEMKQLRLEWKSVDIKALVYNRLPNFISQYFTPPPKVSVDGRFRYFISQLLRYPEVDGTTITSLKRPSATESLELFRKLFREELIFLK